MSDRGSMAVLTMLVAVAITTAALAALAPFAGALADRQRAQTAADAAALAGVLGGRPAAADLAATNGGVLTGWRHVGHDVIVTVRVDDHEATARATNGP